MNGVLGTRPSWPRRGVLLAAGAAAVWPAAGRAEWLRDEIVVYADPALRPVLAALGAAFQAARGIRVRCFCAAPAQMTGLLAHGTQDDVLITQTAFMDDAVARGLAAGPAKTLWRNRLVFAAAGAGAHDEVFDAGALRAALGAGTLALPDASDAGTLDGPALLARLRVTDVAAGHVLAAASSEDAVASLKCGEATLALCHASEVRTDAALRVALSVPDEAYDPIQYQVALSRAAWSRHQDAFLRWLAGDAAGAARAMGLEVLA